MRGGCVTGGGWGGLHYGMGVSVSGASVLDALGDPGWSLGLEVLLPVGFLCFSGQGAFCFVVQKKKKNYVNLTIKFVN